MAKGRSKPQIHDARYLAELMDKTGVPEIFKARGGGSSAERPKARHLRIRHRDSD